MAENKSNTAPPGITVLPSAIHEAVIAELMDYFSDPLVSGKVLPESEADYIAGGVVERVLRRVAREQEPTRNVAKDFERY